MGFRNLAAVAAATLNPFSSSSTLSSSVSYSNFPSVRDGASDSYGGHASAIRSSTSLQDISSYSKVTVERNEAIAPSSRDAHQEQPPLHQSWRDSSFYSSKSIKANAARTSQSTWWRKSNFWHKLAGVIAVVCVVLLTYFSFHWLRLNWRSEKLHYAVVLDCGSTGTRVQVYSWAYRDSSGLDQLPIISHQISPQASRASYGRRSGWRKENRAYHRMETEPGLDKLLRNESGVKAAVEPLLQWAQTQISSSAHSSTPIFLLATAGMRKLDTADAEWLLDKAWVVLEKSPFLCKRSWVKVISGVEEAYYGWVALNYNFGRLGQIPQQSTFGALDLGGSSLQVTFESDEVDHNEYGLNLTVGSAEHHLYAFSHAGFGLNDAFDKSVEVLWSDSEKNNGTEAENVEIQHPCLHKGYREQYKCSRCMSQASAAVPKGVGRKVSTEQSQHTVILVGKPDWDACKLLASAIIMNASRGSSASPAYECFDPPCALGRYQPVPHGQFYALSGFFVVYKFFGLLPDAHFEELLNRGKDFCAKPWKEAFDSVVPQPLVEHYCFRAPYVVSLIQDGLHLKEEQIVVGSGDMTWTLGAALLEAGAFITRKLRGDAPIRSGLRDSSRSFSILTVDTGLLSLFLLVAMVAILFGVTYFHHCASLLWKKPQLPLFSQPSLGYPWSSSTIFSPIYRVFNRGDIATRNGEGKCKAPHSPAPLGSLQDQPQSRFDSVFSAVGKPMLELTGSQPPVSGPYESIKMPHMGSKLSSRRTQSRDDLIKYVHE